MEEKERFHFVRGSRGYSKKKKWRDRYNNRSCCRGHNWCRHWCSYKRFEATGKALGNGLKDVGSRVASALPGLISSTASFLFKSTGQDIGFVAEHTWLLILAVVTFLVEKYIKKRR